MPYASASDGARIFYEARGDGEPLLLSTASFCTHRHWEHQAEALAAHFRLVVWDYRGHGQSDAPDDDARFSLAQVTDDLRCVHAEVVGDEPSWIGGLSIGGLVSLSYALAHPARTRGLLLLNTGPGFKNPKAAAGWTSMLEKAATKMQTVGLETYLEGRRARDEILGLQPDSEAARTAREGFLTSSTAGLTRFARRVAGPVPNLVDELQRIDVPALVLIGELDPNFERASHVLAAKLPRATRVVLPGAGHVVNLDQPDAFVREMVAFPEKARGLARGL